MKTLWRRYPNEIVGLTIMALMTLALIEGEAHNVAGDSAADGNHGVIEIRLTAGD